MEATPGQVGALAHVSGRAFVEEPMTLWSFGEHGNVEARLTSAFHAFSSRWSAWGRRRRPPAARVPLCGFHPTAPRAGRHPWSHPQIIAVAEDRRRYEAFWDWVGCRHSAQPAWLLDSIAVEPAAQGRGLGRALVAAGLASARADGSARFSRQGPSVTSRSMGDVAFVWPRRLTRPRAAPRSISCDRTRSQSRPDCASFAAVLATLPSDLMGSSRRDL